MFVKVFLLAFVVYSVCCEDETPQQTCEKLHPDVDGVEAHIETDKCHFHCDVPHEDHKDHHLSESKRLPDHTPCGKEGENKFCMKGLCLKKVLPSA